MCWSHKSPIQWLYLLISLNIMISTYPLSLQSSSTYFWFFCAFLVWCLQCWMVYPAAFSWTVETLKAIPLSIQQATRIPNLSSVQKISSRWTIISLMCLMQTRGIHVPDDTPGASSTVALKVAIISFCTSTGCFSRFTPVDWYVKLSRSKSIFFNYFEPLKISNTYISIYRKFVEL